MDFYHEINHIVTASAYVMSQKFEKYSPPIEERYPTERNITLNLALTFQSIHLNDGLIFQELPIEAPLNAPNDNHIDMYMSCDNYSVLVEAKSLYRKEQVTGLIADAKRISDQNIVRQIKTRFSSQNSNKKTYSLVIGQTMSPKYLKNWKAYKNQNSNPTPFNNPNWFFHGEKFPYNTCKETKKYSIVWAIIEV